MSVIWNFESSQVPTPNRETRILLLVALCMSAGSVLALFWACGGWA